LPKNYSKKKVFVHNTNSFRYKTNRHTQTEGERESTQRYTPATP